MMFGGGWFGGIFMIIFWIVLILAGVALVRWMMGKGSFGAGPCGGGNSPSSRPGRSLDILKERYAAGEITKAEFESMKRDLEA
ncbi:MAG: SHOCT domain-containing protein [Deltaproteobacteria bacterium]|nr:SHOCT domain-containing protein [Deltaproteobacteria bacterium]